MIDQNNRKGSVVIPCFNDGSHIVNAIRSILNQTYKNIEVIIVMMVLILKLSKF